MTSSESQTALIELLEAAKRRFIARNPRSAEHQLIAARVMPGGNTRTVLFYEPFPLVMARGEGCRLWDVDDHEYIDFLGEFTAGIYGHSHPIIRQAITAAVDNGLSLASHHVLEARLAGALCERFALERVRFTNSGTEATLMALSLAREITRRPKMMVFEGAYHGSLLNFRGAGRTLNVPFEFVMAPYNDSTQTLELLQRHRSELAAVMVEPMLGSGGCIAASREFLGMLREATEQIGAVLVFDEVMTSRLAPGGLQAVLGIRPDLTTLGKYLGGGSSFGAFGGRAALMDHFDPRRPGALPHAGTFNNNVISLAAGLAGLTQVYTPEQAEALNRRGSELRERLNALCRQARAPLQFTGIGSLLNAHATTGAINAPRDLAAAYHDVEGLLFFDLVEKGIYTARRGFIALSLALGAAELDRLVAAVGEFLEAHESQLTRLSAARDAARAA